MTIERNDTNDPRGIEISPGIWHLKKVFPNGQEIDSMTNTNKPCNEDNVVLDPNEPCNECCTWGWTDPGRKMARQRMRRMLRRRK